MQNTEYLNPLVVGIVHEHREILDALRELLQQARKPAGKNPSKQFAAVARDLSALRDKLLAHFRREEEGGVLEEAAIRLPRLSHKIGELQREHGDLLRQLEEVLHAVRTAAADGAAWRRVAGEVETFVARMMRHEAVENRLLQEGLNEDFTASDLGP